MTEFIDLSGSPDASPEGRLCPPLPAGAVSGRATRLNPKYGPEETVPGLECSYGSLAYSYAAPPDEVAQHSRHVGCSNPVEAPEQRRHCRDCGGGYCAVHAEPAAHDCGSVLTSP